MSRPARLVALLLAAAALSAGCGSAARQGSAAAIPVRPPSLATSLVTATGTWAVAVLGGSAAQHNNFWQLFVRPAATGRWRLATPPGVASNGGLVLAGLGAGSVVAGFRPSQDLSYSPLATSRDDGTAWTPGLLDAALADVPDALAAAPGSGRLLALLGGGTAELSGSGGTAWARLATRRALAASAAGRRCGPGSLTAVAFSPAGVPLLAASCTRPGTAGIFAYAGGTWRPAGPALPPGYAHLGVTVLRLTTTGGTTTALLAAGTGPAARLLAAWSADGGAHWALSQPLPLHGAAPASASSGTGGAVAVVLTGNRAETVTPPAGSWRPLPALPPGTATLATAAKGGWDALAVHGTKLAVWQLTPGSGTWAAAQTVNVPVQFGSSG
ncbi:MAG TPA: hypothetical protein VLW44_08740 [Streptosporangiaceae bacterium]|nr:hypothetical protein [Streptosporangiaceae bacterium]